MGARRWCHGANARAWTANPSGESAAWTSPRGSADDGDGGDGAIYLYA